MNKSNQNRQNELDLIALLQVLLEHIGIIIACSLFVGFIAFCVASFYMPTLYESSTLLYVKSVSSKVKTTKDGYTEGYINSNDLRTAQSLISTYMTVLKIDSVMAEASERLTEKYEKENEANIDMALFAPGAIKGSISMSSVNDTEVMKITSRTRSAQASADICNTIAEIAPKFIDKIVDAGTVEIIEAAKPNYAPVEPNIKRTTAMGIMLGFVLSAGLLTLMYLLDNTVKSTDELTKRFNKSIIGEVFNFSQEKGEKRKKKGERRIINSEDLINENTVFTIAESYKTMRTNAVFALSPFDKKVFAVTSANAAEGKSTTVANLAIAFAQTENKVLLIDADMRKPVQHKLFEVKNVVGLSSAISKMCKVDKCIHHNVRQNLDLITSGQIPPNPSELLDSQQFETIIGELADKYDYIIIDTPPVNVVSDVLVMSKSISGAMFVTRHGSTTYDSIEEALRKLELAEIKMLGFVFNNVVKNHGGKYYSYYKYKYKYGYKYDYGYGERTKKKNKSI